MMICGNSREKREQSQGEQTKGATLGKNKRTHVVLRSELIDSSSSIVRQDCSSWVLSYGDRVCGKKEEETSSAPKRERERKKGETTHTSHEAVSSLPSHRPNQQATPPEPQGSFQSRPSPQERVELPWANQSFKWKETTRKRQSSTRFGSREGQDETKTHLESRRVGVGLTEDPISLLAEELFWWKETERKERRVRSRWRLGPDRGERTTSTRNLCS